MHKEQYLQYLQPFERLCNNSVDLPIPGSPPKSINAPGTMPPPNTRSISPKVVDKRAIDEISISGKAVGLVV